MAKTKKGSEPNAKQAKAAAGAKAGGKDKDAKGDGGPLKRKLGLRGAAPWAARHAAKHAAEARARAAEPPLPGSARATIRTPDDAEEIKRKIGELHNALVQIKGFRKNLHKTFYDIGNILKDVQDRRLYAAKGYPSFEVFLEREIDFGKMTGLRLVKVVTTFLREAAQELGMERLFTALAALESTSEMKVETGGKVPPAPISTTALPLRPPGK